MPVARREFLGLVLKIPRPSFPGMQTLRNLLAAKYPEGR
jgi:hypothetical protein